MALSSFDDKACPPTAETLAAMLGAAAKHWGRLVGDVQRDHGPLAEQWNFAGAKFGWSLRMKDAKRVVVYLTPCRGHLIAGLVLGEKAVAAARRSDLPAPVVRLIEETRPYAEGRGVRIEVRNAASLKAVLKLVSIRMASV